MNFIITYINYSNQYCRETMFGSWDNIAITFSQVKGISTDFIISIEKEPF